MGKLLSTVDGILACHPATLGLNPSFPKIYKLLKLIDGTALNIGQRLDNVDRTQLELASGKLVLQKSWMSYFSTVYAFSIGSAKGAKFMHGSCCHCW